MNYLSDNSYLAVKPEAQEGVAVIPTEFTPLVSESIKTNQNLIADRRFKGLDWKANDLLKGNRMHEGDISLMADADALAHFFNMFLLKGSTSGDATDGYTHPFTVGDADSYTIEIQKGIYAQRYFGVKANELRLEFNEGLLQLRAGVRAMGQFSVAKLGIALSTSVTTLVLGDEYDIAPNTGLVVGDVIVIGTDELTLTSVNADGVTVGFTSTALSYSIGEPIYLKAQTPSYSGLQDPLCFGNMLVGIGVDESASTTAAGSKATATPIHDVAIVLRNNLLETPRSGSIDPVTLIPQTKEGEIQLKQLLENEDERGDFLAKTKQALTMIIKGKHINPDFSTRELVTLKFHNVKMREHENPLNIGEYIMDEKTYEVLYDDSDAKAMTVDIINNTAGGDY